MKKQIITLTIAALIAGSCGAHIPLGMYRSVEARHCRPSACIP